MNRRGQFFLIAALIIVLILIGLGTVDIATKVGRENFRVFNLANELDLEGKSVVDYGIYADLDSGSFNDEIENIFQVYADLNPGSNLTLVVGNEDGYTIFEATEDPFASFQIGGGVGETFSGIKVTSTEVTCETTCDTAAVEITEEIGLEFDLEEEGQNFFLVIVDGGDEGTTVVTNKPSGGAEITGGQSTVADHPGEPDGGSGLGRVLPFIPPGL